MQEITSQEAKELVDSIGPHLGYDFTYAPVFPKDRNDICAVCRLAEDGVSYGYDTVYLVWKESNGELGYKKIMDSRSTKDYIQLKEVRVNKDGSIVVNLGSAGSFSGTAWNKSVKVMK